MEKLLFQTADYRQHYNCTFYDFDAAVPLASRQRIAPAILLLAWTIILEALYLPSLYVMTRPKNFQQSCYRLMVYLGVVEASGLCSTGFAFSYFMIRGYAYCNSPIAIYLVGIAGTCLWFAESSTSVILGLNRCLIIYDAKLASRLFDGNWRITAWLSVPTALMLWTFWHANPFIVNPIYFSPYFNPYIGFFDEDPFHRYKFYFYYNVGLVFVLVALYTTFCVSLLFTRRNIRSETVNAKRRSSELMIFIQTFMICLLSLVAILGYLLHEAFPRSHMWAMIATFGYVSYQGGPALVYLIFNSSIRRFIFRRSDALLSSTQLRMNKTMLASQTMTWRTPTSKKTYSSPTQLSINPSS